jgi:tetrapyrrole methylase family protein/MazG family protein
MPDQYKTRSVNDLVSIMEKLLSPEGCPWDREQTLNTLAPFAIEEAFELAEAIDNNDLAAIKEELGDLLLQVVFQTALTKRQNQFTLEDVIEGICTKLIRRHPHVFADDKVKDADEVLKNWNIIKASEKKDKVQRFFNIPANLPALQRSQKIGDKTKTLKFDWKNTEEVLLKVEEEMLELKEALKDKDTAHVKEELGDVFFVLAQLARHLKFEAESVARAANSKFEKRFENMLNLAKSKGMEFVDLTSEKKEELWAAIKKLEPKKES